MGKGADPGFFLGGGALVSYSTSIPINHIVFFFFVMHSSCIFYLEGTNSKITIFAHFQEYHRNCEKKKRVYMVLGDAVTKLQTYVCMDLYTCFKSYNLITV